MNRTEADIIVSLQNAPPVQRYAEPIAAKLHKTYTYVTTILRQMTRYRYVSRHTRGRRVYYEPTKTGISEAEKVLSS